MLRTGSFLFVLLGLMASPVFAQTAGMLSFQGLIKDNMGNPITGSVNLEFRIFDAATAGNLVDMDGDGVVENVIGQDVKQVLGVSVTNGILSTKFGPVHPGSFDGSLRWLEVSVGGSPLSRVEMATAPGAAEQVNQPASVIPALRIEPNATSPNLIGGHSSNEVTSGAVGATIGGGGSDPLNSVTDDFGTVSARDDMPARNATFHGPNFVTDDFGTIPGGLNNQAGNADASRFNAQYATVGGGHSNTASGPSCSVGGGENNTASAGWSTVGGGENNTASNVYATVGGGKDNAVEADFGTVAGGGQPFYAPSTANIVYDNWGTVSGGGDNHAGSDDGVTTTAMLATVGGGGSNNASAQSSTVSGGNFNTASGDVSTVGGGVGNTASGDGSTVGGGSGNTASEFASTVGGGQDNTASKLASTVGGGQNNTASGTHSTIAGGVANDASGDTSTIGGGFLNRAIGSDSTVAGGNNNEAGGVASTVQGGLSNSAGGNYSFAAGRRAKANSNGMFVWADSTDKDFPSSTEPNFTPAVKQFLARATGGVVFVTAVDGSGDSISGTELPAGSGSWSSWSSRDAKANVANVDGREILQRLRNVPIATWNYKAQDESIRHIGPMAQDFSAAFGVGEKETMITTIDADGVALAAIQGLYEIVKEKDCEIGELEAQNQAQQQAISDLQSRLARIEALIVGVNAASQEGVR